MRAPNKKEVGEVPLTNTPPPEIEHPRKKKNNTLHCYIDGDALCVVREDFENVQNSPAVFIKLSEDKMNEIKELEGGRE